MKHHILIWGLVGVAAGFVLTEWMTGWIQIPGISTLYNAINTNQ